MAGIPSTISATGISMTEARINAAEPNAICGPCGASRVMMDPIA